MQYLRILYTKVLKEVVYSLVTPFLYVYLRYMKTDGIHLYCHNPSLKTCQNMVEVLESINRRFKPLSLLENNVYENGVYHLSFDDGWIGNIDCFRLLAKKDIKPTLFIASNASRKGILWTDLLRDNGFSNNEIERLKRTAFVDVEKLLSENKVSSNSRRLMSLVDLQSISELCEIGLHTYDHPILTTCSENVVSREILMNMKDLSPFKYLNMLAYPNGDYNARVAAVCDRIGLNFAFTTSRNYDVVNKRLAMPRICIPNSTSKCEIYARVSGLHDFLRLT